MKTLGTRCDQVAAHSIWCAPCGYGVWRGWGRLKAILSEDFSLEAWPWGRCRKRKLVLIDRHVHSEMRRETCHNTVLPSTTTTYFVHYVLLGMCF